MRGGQPTNSLWSTTVSVVNSGVLDQMTSEEIKLQEAMFEVSHFILLCRGQFSVIYL